MLALGERSFFLSTQEFCQCFLIFQTNFSNFVYGTFATLNPKRIFVNWAGGNVRILSMIIQSLKTYKNIVND